jgi:acyl dehydratase
VQAPESYPAKSFDELSIGDCFHSKQRVVSQADIDAFAQLTHDHNPVHVDEQFARKSLFRGRIAHGLLVESLASGLAWQMGIFHGTIVALVEIGMRFEAAVRPGDTIRLELSVPSTEDSPGPRRGQVRWRTRVLNQHDATVIDGEWLTLLQRTKTARREGEETTK